MKRFRWILASAAICASVGAQSQVVLPQELDFFAGDYPPPEIQPLDEQPVSANPSELAPENPHTLCFHNGRQLRGELAEITATEIFWRRLDASEPLRFRRGDVQRVLIVPEERLADAPPTFSFPKHPAEAAARIATIKMPGSDWLRGTVTSADGQNVALTLKGDHHLQVGRDQIEWLHFGSEPAPTFGLSDGATGLEGWVTGAPPRVESKDGTLTVHDAEWIGNQMASTARFEVAFEVPAEGEEGLRFWIQLWIPQFNTFGPGSMQITLGRKTLKRLVFEESIQEMPLPAEAAAEQGPVRYRVFYDGIERRMLLLRNGRQLGDWSLKRKDEKEGARGGGRHPRGLLFDRVAGGVKVALQFRRLIVRPWDGIPPEAKEAKEDRLSTGTQPTITGRLEAIREKELVFAGESVPLTGQSFVKFPTNPAPLTGIDALLSFGQQGEVSLADVRMGEGKVRGRAVFAPALELPTSALETIAFAPGPVPPQPVGDFLVFRNGDELPGALVTAVSGAPLRWRMASGQEVDFKTEGIAGVRLRSSPKIEPAGTIELRTGERLRGALAGLDEQQVRWRHELLGELVVNRRQLWRLYPNPAPSVRDGGQDPESWLRIPKSPRFKEFTRRRPPQEQWLSLDGRFLVRSGSNGGTTTLAERSLGPNSELGSGYDRFELRLDVAYPGSGPANLEVNFKGPDPAEVAFYFNPSSIDLSVRKNPKASDGSITREFETRGKIDGEVRQLSVRAFVNRPAGTIDFFVDGHYLGRAGETVAECLPGVGERVAIVAYTTGSSPVLLSEITISAWNGALPHFGDGAPTTVLSSGDASGSLPSSFAGGRWKIESEIGPLDFASEQVQSVEFGGERQPTRAAGRLRLIDGSALLVDRFQWAAGEVTAHHATFGDLRFPASAVSELIYDPAPVRPAILIHAVAPVRPAVAANPLDSEE